MIDSGDSKGAFCITLEIQPLGHLLILHTVVTWQLSSRHVRRQVLTYGPGGIFSAHISVFLMTYAQAPFNIRSVSGYPCTHLNDEAHYLILYCHTVLFFQNKCMDCPDTKKGQHKVVHDYENTTLFVPKSTFTEKPIKIFLYYYQITCKT